MKKFNENKKKDNKKEEVKGQYHRLFNLPSKWKPETSKAAEVEKALKAFKDGVIHHRVCFMKLSPSNLMPLQFETIRQLTETIK